MEKKEKGKGRVVVGWFPLNVWYGFHQKFVF
jgi:hypothetical protein